MKHILFLLLAACCFCWEPSVYAKGLDTTYSSHDTSFCSTVHGIILTAPAGYTSYFWNTDSKAFSLPVNDSGVFWVYATDSGKTLIDTFIVHMLTWGSKSHKSYNIKGCAMSGSFILKPAAGYLSYLWNTGSSADTLFVNSNGKFTVYADSGCNVLYDTFIVNITLPDSIHRVGYDTTVCYLKDSLSLNAPLGFNSYFWNTGITTDTMSVTAAGTYWVYNTSNANCTVLVDTIKVKDLNINLSFSLGNDTMLCTPTTLQVPINGGSYIWQDGTTGNTYNVTQAGIYYATASENGCIWSDTIAISYTDLKQNLRDTTLCIELSVHILLQANVPIGASAAWSTGIASSAILATDTGTYWVMVTDSVCLIRDTVSVHGEICNCWCRVPDAFSPNNDGKNDIYHPVFEPQCSIKEYLFCVYDRWGKRIFSTADPTEGWDGKYLGVPQDVGVYMYYLEYVAGPKDTRHFLKGNITLIK